MDENDDRVVADLSDKTPEEQERILKSAREAKKTIIAVAWLAIGGIVFMFLFTIVVLVLTWGK